MKKLGRLLFVLVLCFSIVGCGEESKEPTKDVRSTDEITKYFKKIGYEIKSVKNDDVDTLSLIKENDNGAKSQIISYFEDSNLHSIAYLSSPADPNDYENIIIGFIYASDNIDQKNNEIVKIDKYTVKVAKKVLNKVDLSLDEFVKYVKDVHKDKS